MEKGLPMLNHVLQHTLRGLCCDTQWVYAIFWRILPRNYPPPKWESEGGAADRSKGNKRNWILVWEDGFCDFPACASAKEAQIGSRYGNHSFNHAADHESSEAAMVMHPELFFKMSHEVYNYGEGLMGKVAADNSHKWVYREPLEHEISFLSPWHGSLDPHPRTWEAQFKAGIQTIAVISVREGLVQLGSTKKVVEDLNFVIMMQRKFNYLQSIPGVFVPHPSPLPGSKLRRDGGGVDGSSPTDGGPVWSGSRDQNLINEIFPKSSPNLDPFRIMNALSKQQFSSGVLGIKRPPEPSDHHIPGGLGLPTSISGGRENGFLAPGSALSFNHGGSPGRFDTSGRQSNHHGQPECPSPPKALNTGQNPSSISLLPSMSSLHNLLSKLPSVTAPPESNAGLSSSSPSRLSLTTNAQLQQQKQQQQAALPRQPISPSSSTDSPRRGMSIPGADELDPSPTSPSPSGQQQHTVGNDTGGPMSTSPGQLDHNTTGGGRETSCTTSGAQVQVQQQQRQYSSSCSRGSTEFAVDSRSFQSRDHHHGHGHRAGSGSGTSSSGCSKDMMGPPPPAPAAASKDKLTSFLDSFDQDSLTDLGLNDDLENSETYNSFLNEII
ncbi:unnamed protein product [Calypogeia fissa]